MSVVSHTSVEALDALCVRARKADEDCTLSVLTDAIHNKKSKGYRPALM